MTSRQPPIVPCPCPKRCPANVVNWAVGQWRVMSRCGFLGPVRYTKRTAREAWNRRDTAEAERRGAMAAAQWMRAKGFTLWAQAIEIAIERGEVTGKAAKPGKLPGKRGGR